MRPEQIITALVAGVIIAIVALVKFGFLKAAKNGNGESARQLEELRKSQQADAETLINLLKSRDEKINQIFELVLELSLDHRPDPSTGKKGWMCSAKELEGPLQQVISQQTSMFEEIKQSNEEIAQILSSCERSNINTNSQFMRAILQLAERSQDG